MQLVTNAARQQGLHPTVISLPSSYHSENNNGYTKSAGVLPKALVTINSKNKK